MLYESLQTKSIKLENRLIKKNSNQEEISEFIEIINDCIPLIFEINNYKKTLSLFNKWKTLYYEFFKRIHPAENNFTYTLKNMSPELISEQTLVRLKLEGPPSDLMDFSQLSVIDPIQINNSSQKIDIEEYKFISLGEMYKNSQFEQALYNIKSEILGVTIGETNNYNDLFYLSWLLHMSGNMFIALENYEIAISQYKKSYLLKKKLIKIEVNNKISNDFKMYSYYCTKLKYLAFSSMHDSLGSIDNLLGLKFKIDESFSAKYKEGRYYKTLVSQLDYHLAKKYYYFGDEIKAIKLLDKNIEETKAINDKPGSLRALLHKTVMTASTVSSSQPDFSPIFASLESFSISDKKSPTAKALIGRKHLKEYGALIGKKSYGNQINRIFEKSGILAHETIDLEVIWGKHAVQVV